MIFEPIVPIWVIFALLILGGLLAYWQYGRGGFFGVKIGHRLTLLVTKSAIFLVFGFLLLNPQWVREVSTERPARMAVLFDTSESMNSLEGPDKPTAFQKLRDAFFRQVYPLLSDRADLRFYTFSTKLATADPEILRKEENAGGAATNIRGAIQETLSQQGSSPPAAILLLTDGNHNWGPEPTVDILKAEDSDKFIPLISVSTQAYGEIKKSMALSQVTLPAPIFSDEDTEVRFQVVTSGSEGQKAKIHLLMEKEGEPGEWTEVDSEEKAGEGVTELPLMAASTQGSIPTRFPEGGNYRVTVVAEAEGLGSASKTEEIYVEPGRWRVAYYCGRPGWMNSSLVRRMATVPRYALRVAIDQGNTWSYLVTGRTEPRGPEGESDVEKGYISLEEVAFDADLVILEGLGPDQVAQLPADIIKERLEKGAALLVIVGKSDPVNQGVLGRIGAADRVPAITQSSILAPSKREIAFTDLTAGHPVTNSPIILGVETFLPYAEIPYSKIDTTSEANILIQAKDGSPVLSTMSQGDQRSAFIGADDLWRWQYQAGEKGERLGQAYGVLIDRLIRWLILGEEEDRSVPNIMISQSRIPLGKTIEIGVQYSRTIMESSATVRLSVTTPNQQMVPIALNREPGGFFTADFTGSDPGQYQFVAADPQRPQASDTATIEVEPFSVETAITGAREDLLKNLSSESGGLWVDLADIDDIVRTNQLDDVYQPHVTTRSITEPVMASPWLFLIVIFLFCLEWTIRRLRDLP
ncbi:MAG: VWA domain-containing protein [Candidatus Omnitrophica bacterium]|nr:VWA domain-containing protein [Candidatus Omnitrophota bacterium]